MTREPPDYVRLLCFEFSKGQLPYKLAMALKYIHPITDVRGTTFRPKDEKYEINECVCERQRNQQIRPDGQDGKKFLMCWVGSEVVPNGDYEWQKDDEDADMQKPNLGHLKLNFNLRKREQVYKQRAGKPNESNDAE